MSADPQKPEDKESVHVSPDLLPMITGLSTTAQEQHVVKEQRDLNQVVHRLLIVGLIASTALMLTGLGLDLLLHHEVPTTTSSIVETWQRVLALRPSGFLTLGMLVLIATPILRVVGSIITYAYERDWRYTVITAIVFAIVMLSLLSGRA